VLAGSTLYSAEPDDQLHVVVEATGENTRLGEMVRLLDRALLDKPRLALIADRVAVWFTGGLLLLAALTALAWWLIDPSRIIAAFGRSSSVRALSLAHPRLPRRPACCAALLLVLRGRALETSPGRRTGFRQDRYADLGRSGCSAWSRWEACARVLGTPRLREGCSIRSVRRCRRIAGAWRRHRAHAGAGVEGLVDGRRYRLGTCVCDRFTASRCRPPLRSPPTRLVALADAEADSAVRPADSLR
jgi:Cu2+-exporting ATPase